MPGFMLRDMLTLCVASKRVGLKKQQAVAVITEWQGNCMSFDRALIVVKKRNSKPPPLITHTMLS